MLRRYIERHERALHGRDSNRTSLPFDWGLEHIGLPVNGNPRGAFREYSAHALTDSAKFFSYLPTQDYDCAGGLLRFPSALRTPYPENNTVWGRFFEGGNDLGVIVLPQWNCSWDGQIGLCRVLQRAGFSVLRLSMPYHHKRKPPHLKRSEYLVSANIGRTLAAARQSVLDARRAADWLFLTGRRRVAIVGSSIGSCIAFLTFSHDERFSAGVFIHVSGYFADVVWSGLSTSHVRVELEKGVGLDELRALWSPISPFPFIQQLRGGNRPILMLSGEYDLTFPPSLTRDAYQEFRRWDVPAEMCWLPCGHYTMAKFPFSAVAGFKIVQFLRRLART
jgi:pimeloyl-ACP methyl ester carboxylesterase